MATMNDLVRKSILEFISEYQGIESSQIDWDLPIGKSVFLDSVSTIELLMYLETKVSVSLPLSDMLLDFPETLNILGHRVSELCE